jgi:hypothetical protein
VSALTSRSKMRLANAMPLRAPATNSIRRGSTILGRLEMPHSVSADVPRPLGGDRKRRPGERHGGCSRFGVANGRFGRLQAADDFNGIFRRDVGTCDPPYY